MNKKNIFAFFALSTGLLLVILFALFFGSSGISLSGPQAGIILWKLRLPRILLGLLVGAGLSCCGVTFQAILRNSLAEPYTLGITSGAALGAIIAMIMNLGSVPITLFSFTGSLITIFLVYAIASKKCFSNSAIILSGVTLGFLFSSLVLLIFSLAKHEGVRSAAIWLMGDLSYANAGLLKVIAIFVLSGIGILILLAKEIDVICLGEEKARYLGMDVVYVKAALFLTASLITGACVAAAGIIGFVGLIIPHVCRFLFGPNHRRLLMASALTGAIFLIFCDTLARIIVMPLELPVGVITGIFGGIFFMWLLLKSKRQEMF